MQRLVPAAEFSAVADSAVALATLALALVTWLTVRASKRTATAAEAQVAVQSKPLLIEVDDDQAGTAYARAVEFSDGLSVALPSAQVLARVADKGYISVPVRNVGAGIAAISGVQLLIGPGGLAGTMRRPHLPPGEATRINFVVPRDPSLGDYWTPFTSLIEGKKGGQPGDNEVPWDTAGLIPLAVSYTDLAGQQPTQTQIEIKCASDDGGHTGAVHRVQHYFGEDALPLFEVDPMNLRC